jgi:HAD superfamily hydrolase (TIGR01549 family)
MNPVIVFDVDGTLVDSVEGHAQAWQDSFRRWGKEIPFQAIRDQIGKGGDQLMPVFLDDGELESFGRELEEWRGRRYRESYLPEVRPFPQVRELFERLRKMGLRIVLASSAKDEELETYVDLTGIQDLISGSTSADDANRSKPHPDIFEAALTKAGIRADGALVVGDSPYDAEAASRAGIGSVGMLSGGFSRDWLEEAGFIAIYDDPADLLRRVEDSPLARLARGA